MGWFDQVVERGRADSANDPKLSDGGGRRSLCGKVAGGERSEAAGAQAVTPGAVRSAWFGDVG